MECSKKRLDHCDKVSPPVQTLGRTVNESTIMMKSGPGRIHARPKMGNRSAMGFEPIKAKLGTRGKCARSWPLLVVVRKAAGEMDDKNNKIDW